MRKMKDVELRVVLQVTRATLGWEEDPKTGLRKSEDWLSQSQLIQKTGRSNRAISTAIDSCIKNGWIEARDKNGNQLNTPKERSGKRVYYRLGKVFMRRIKTCEKSSQDNQTCEDISKTCEKSSVKKVHSTKETYNKNIDIPNGISSDASVAEVIHLFEQVNPSCKKYYNNTTQRKACKSLIDLYGFEQIAKVIKILPKTNGMEYAPTITTPCQLEDKYKALEAFCRKKFNKVKEKFEEEKIFNQLISIKHNQ